VQLTHSSTANNHTEELDDSHNLGASKIPDAQQIFVPAHDEVRFRSGSAFENTVIIGVFFYYAEDLGWRYMIADGKQFAACIVKPVTVPLKLVAKNASCLIEDRLGNVNANISGSCVAKEQSRRTRRNEVLLCRRCYRGSRLSTAALFGTGFGDEAVNIGLVISERLCPLLPVAQHFDPRAVFEVLLHRILMHFGKKGIGK
jgi:hypothetical protein